MDELKRFGISMDAELLDRFDRLIEVRGYASRSEAIRDLVRKQLMEEDIKSGKKEIVGIVSFTYDHERSGTTEKILDIQHHKARNSFNMHLHLDEKMCLEVAVIRGNAGEIRALAERIGAVKGVENCEVMMMATVSGEAKVLKEDRDNGTVI